MKAITVAAVQSLAVPGDLPRAVSNHARLAVQAAHKGARLAVFPELSLTGYSLALTRSDALTSNDPRLQMLQQISDAHDIVILARKGGASGRLHPYRSPFPTDRRA